MKLHLLLSVCLNMLFFSALADPKQPLGAVKDAEFIIEKQKKNELPEANRLFAKARLPKQTLPDKQDFAYDLGDIKLPLKPLEQKIKLLKAKSALARLYGHYIQVGYGYPYSPYLGIYLTDSSYQYTYGIHVQHASSGSKKHLEAHDNVGRLYGKWSNAKLSVDVAIWLKLNKFPLRHWPNGMPHDLGAGPKFYQLGLQTGLSNYALHNEGWRYAVPIRLSYLRNQQKEQEQQCHLQAKFSYPIQKNLLLETQLDFRLSQYQYKQEEAKKRHIESIKSSCILAGNNITMQAGLNLVHQKDVSVASAVHIYPLLEINYRFFKWLSAYVGVKGDIEPNTWHSLIATNPWLKRQPKLTHTNQSFAFSGGLQGFITPQITLHMGAMLTQYQNLPFLLNSDSDHRKFVVRYDSETSLINTFGELVMHPTTYLKTSLKGNYYRYKPKQMARPWHKPKYEIALSSVYKFYDKILCTGSLVWVGGIEALEPQHTIIHKLASSVELSFRLDYLWNQRFGIFLDGQNLLRLKQSRYLYVPNQGLVVLLGVNYTW